MGKVYKNDVGTKIAIDTGQDVSGADSVKIKYIKPDGTTGLWDAIVDTDDKTIYYLTQVVSGDIYDLDQIGVWMLFPVIDMVAWDGHGESVELTVYDIAGITITVGTNSWISLAEANDYFATRVGSSLWNESNPIEKAQALVSAFNQLSGCGLFDIPSEITSNLKNAQCEMALFILKYQEDIDARKGLQAQGVSSAGIVQETYDKDMMSQVPVPPIVKSMLSEYESGSNLEALEAKRDDDEEIT